ncbi:hypothetical protein Tco_0106789, partial [Tanacetum coccineum]
MGGCGGDEGGSHGCGMVAVVAESDGGGKARGGEWVWGSSRSVDEEHL